MAILKNSVFLSQPFWFFLLHFHENQSKVLGYQEWVEILMITLVFSQKSLPQTFQPAVYLQKLLCTTYFASCSTHTSWFFMRRKWTLISTFIFFRQSDGWHVIENWIQRSATDLACLSQITTAIYHEAIWQNFPPPKF